MGVRIGQIPAALPQLDAFTARRLARAADGQLREQGQKSARDKQDDFVRTGFGKDTLSTPAAALKTVAAGVESARELVPTLEEAQAQAEEVQAEVQQNNPPGNGETTDGVEAPPAPTVSARPKAEPFARFFKQDRFFQQDNGAVAPDTTETAPAPQSQTPAPPPQPASFAFAFAGSGSAETDGAAALLNLLA